MHLRVDVPSADHSYDHPDEPAEEEVGASMAGMTDYEATAVNVVVSYLAGLNEPLPAEVITSLAVLAKRANGRLQSGWDEGSVRAQWPEPFAGSRVAE